MTALTNRRAVSADDLNAVMEFDHVIYSHGDGTVSDVSGVYAPEVHGGDTFTHGTWELLRGRTGQYGYDGPCMHPSEYVGGGLARDILNTPGLYVACADYEQCNDDDKCDGCAEDTGCEYAPASWVIAHDATTPVSVPPSAWDLTPDTHMDASELGIDTSTGPVVDVYVNDDGSVWVDMTEGTEWHAASWVDTWGTTDRGPFDTDGDLTDDGLSFTRDQLRRIYPDTVWHVDRAAWDTPAVEASVELPAPVTHANVGEVAHGVWARLANVMDPGTFGSEYLYSRAVWNKWTEARSNG